MKGFFVQEFKGKWRITQMELWDQEAMDLVCKAYISFEGRAGGEFQFICVHGYLDCVYSSNKTHSKVEFSWSGNDECDPASGRGWAKIDKSGNMAGKIVFHQGDTSGFKASRFLLKE